MSKYLKSEILKQKRSFNGKVFWAVPVICVATAFLIMAGNFILPSAYNWWYVLFLPFTFMYISASLVSKEKKHNYHGLFAVSADKKQLWYAKIIAATLYLMLACLCFCALCLICGGFYGMMIPAGRIITASLLLAVTFAWQIPFFMFLALKLNMYVCILVSIICNFVIACDFAVKSSWWIPFCIPARIMCPVINVLPNGLPMEEGNPLGNTHVIWIGLIITIILYGVFSVISARIYERQEV